MVKQKYLQNTITKQVIIFKVWSEARSVPSLTVMNGY